MPSYFTHHINKFQQVEGVFYKSVYAGQYLVVEVLCPVIRYEHRRRIRTSNVLERVSQEIKRRTRVIRIFPNEASCLRLVSAVLMEISEDWVTGRIYLNFKSG
ncbi:MAG: hypothetical protein FVQ83_12990 [Chloroflexi bacterium]|nr:hypothetical protein [Chloroflexota bacterium]